MLAAIVGEVSLGHWQINYGHTPPRINDGQPVIDKDIGKQ